MKLNLSHLNAELYWDQTLLDASPQGSFSIRFDPSHLFGLGWAFDRGNHGRLYFGICRWDEGEHAELDVQRLGKHMDALCDVSGGTTKWWPWWTYDARAFSSLPIASDWSVDPDAWLMLNDREQTGFAFQVIEMVKRVQLEFDWTLLNPRQG